MIAVIADEKITPPATDKITATHTSLIGAILRHQVIKKTGRIKILSLRNI